MADDSDSSILSTSPEQDVWIKTYLQGPQTNEKTSSQASQSNSKTHSQDSPCFTFANKSFGTEPLDCLGSALAMPEHPQRQLTIAPLCSPTSGRIVVWESRKIVGQHAAS